MPSPIRELRYVRHRVADLAQASHFASEIFGLMAEDKTDTEALFRSDRRFYSLCLSTELPDAVGFNVHKSSDLAPLAEAFEAAGFPVQHFNAGDAARRLVKDGFSVTAPHSVPVEVVWRHMESGWKYHGPRDTGLDGFTAVQMGATDPKADADFWAIPGLAVTDYVGEARFVGLGDRHHLVAIYPSAKNGLIGATWQVSHYDYIMRHGHYLVNQQVPVVHGPGRQPTSDSVFVTTQMPDNFMMSYATKMAGPPEHGPRQFRDEAKSHCMWGSRSARSEFKGNEQ